MSSDEAVTDRAGRVRAMTGLTPPECAALRPHGAHALLASMEHHTLDGQPRTSRRYSPDDPSPFPPMADKGRFLLPSLQPPPIQEVQGQRCGLSPSHANTWRPLLQRVRHQALAPPEGLPARTAGALAPLLASPPPKDGATAPLVGRLVRSEPAIGRGLPRAAGVLQRQEAVPPAQHPPRDR